MPDGRYGGSRTVQVPGRLMSGIFIGEKGAIVREWIEHEVDLRDLGHLVVSIQAILKRRVDCCGSKLREAHIPSIQSVGTVGDLIVVSMQVNR